MNFFPHQNWILGSFGLSTVGNSITVPRLCLCLSLRPSIATAAVFPSVGTQANFERQNGHGQCFHKKSFDIVSWQLFKKAQRRSSAFRRLALLSPNEGYYQRSLSDHICRITRGSRFPKSTDWKYSVLQFLVQKMWFLSIGPVTMQLRVTQGIGPGPARKGFRGGLVPSAL